MSFHVIEKLFICRLQTVFSIFRQNPKRFQQILLKDCSLFNLFAAFFFCSLCIERHCWCKEAISLVIWIRDFCSTSINFCFHHAATNRAVCFAASSTVALPLLSDCNLLCWNQKCWYTAPIVGGFAPTKSATGYSSTNQIIFELLFILLQAILQ